LSTGLRAQLDSLNSEWLMLMRAGRFTAAWEVSDRALELRRAIDCSAWPRHEQFVWQGAPLTDRRVLVRCYHGLGDTIQFARFATRVRRTARELVMWVQPPLIPLLQTWECADRYLPLHEGAPEVEYDVDVELAELMHVLRVTESTLAIDVPFLRAAGARRAARTSGAEPAPASEGGAALNVGLIWAAGEWDSRRSIPSELLAPLGAIRGIEWHLLQRGPASSNWHNHFGHAPRITGMVDEAHVISGMDLVITVDTCSAHLAGSLGVPVWTLLHHEADWRWLHDRADTPWYPTMRLIRQPSPGAWPIVIHKLARELRQLVDHDSTWGLRGRTSGSSIV
jgi:hypothetical protein